MKPLVPIATLALALATPGPALPCAPAPPAGYEVAIAQEEALVVWDEAKGIQHFIRRAAFQTKAPDFGFLVPTPTAPELAEADDSVFARLEEVIRPIVRHETVRAYELACVTLGTLGRSAVDAAPQPVALAPPPVRVLSTARVAGLDAVVLEADSATELGKWLEDHEYPFRPALTEWVEPYVARKWKITAFKVSRERSERRGEAEGRAEHQVAAGGDGAAADVGSKAVRMSFATDTPFFPYREPTDSGAQSARSLRVFLVGSARMSASLDAKPWAAKLDYAASSVALPNLLAGALPAAAIPREAWLTAYLDTSSTRARSDVTFAPAPGAPSVIPPPVVIAHRDVVPIPLEGIAILAIPAGFLLLRRSRSRGRFADPDRDKRARSTRGPV